VRVIAVGFVFTVAVLVVVAWWTVVTMRRWHRAAAVRHAVWESYSDVQGGGMAEVGVRLVARWGRREEVLKSEEMTRVRCDDLSSTVLEEAVIEADLLAASYNAVRSA
jgi:hypothetical protein